jgi:hypothetical protein
MKSILITYDLHKPARDYQTLYDAIMSYTDYKRVLESVWVIKTNLNALDVVNHLSGYVDSNDTVFTASLSRDVAWLRIPDDVAGWLNSQL